MSIPETADPLAIAARLSASLAAYGVGTVRVVRAEDLLIHKMIKIRTDRRRILQDLADIRALFEGMGPRLDWGYLRQWLPEAEAKLLESASQLDDEALLERLLPR